MFLLFWLTSPRIDTLTIMGFGVRIGSVVYQVKKLVSTFF